MIDGIFSEAVRLRGLRAVVIQTQGLLFYIFDKRADYLKMGFGATNTQLQRLQLEIYCYTYNSDGIFLFLLSTLK